MLLLGFSSSLNPRSLFCFVVRPLLLLRCARVQAAFCLCSRRVCTARAAVGLRAARRASSKCPCSSGRRRRSTERQQRQQGANAHTAPRALCRSEMPASPPQHSRPPFSLHYFDFTSPTPRCDHFQSSQHFFFFFLLSVQLGLPFFFFSSVARARHLVVPRVVASSFAHSHTRVLHLPTQLHC